MKKIAIAIDGPAGAGKSTVAKLVAKQLAYIYIDTGAMFRAVAWKVLKEQQSVENEKKVTELAQTMKLEFNYLPDGLQVVVDNIDVTAAIRSAEVTALVPAVAKIPALRQVLLHLQQAMAQNGGVVMDGRDIGTKVLPNAQVKIFLNASIQERAKRRWQEMQAKNSVVELATIEAEIASRDKQDYERKTAPLLQAADAVLIDTTHLTITEVVEEILAVCQTKGYVL